MDIKDVINKLRNLIDEGNVLKLSEKQLQTEFCPEIINTSIYKVWCYKSYNFIKNFDDKEQVKAFYNIITSTAYQFEDGANDLIAILESYYDILLYQHENVRGEKIEK